MPPKLTPTEKANITAGADKAAKFLTGKKALPEALDNVLALVQELKGRTEPPIIGKEAIALWQAKIDFAIANGDTKNVSKLTKIGKASSLAEKIRAGGTVALWDNNGGCSCGGGGGGPAGW